jgi:hypothetical protein
LENCSFYLPLESRILEDVDRADCSSMPARTAG